MTKKLYPAKRSAALQSNDRQYLNSSEYQETTGGETEEISFTKYRDNKDYVSFNF